MGSHDPLIAAHILLLVCGVNTIATDTAEQKPQTGVNLVDLMEEMLFQRAASGIRPVLYVSSYTDLECSMLMLLDDTSEVNWSATRQAVAKQTGCHIVTN